MASLTVARIALGCGNFGGIGSAPEFFGQGLGEDQALALMDAAWQAGISHFDTAGAERAAVLAAATGPGPRRVTARWPGPRTAGGQ